MNSAISLGIGSRCCDVSQPSNLPRRTVLKLCGSLGLASVAGCSQLESQPPQLTISIFNQTDRSYNVPITLYEWESSRERDDARGYETTFELAANGDAQREGVVNADAYIVRYSVYQDGGQLVDQGHTHYYPREENSELAFDIRDGELTRRFYHS